MNPFWTKLTINLSVTLGVLLTLAFIIFGVGNDIKSNSDAIYKLNQDLNSRSASLSEIAHLKTTAAEIPPLLEKLKRALPSGDELIGISSELNLISRHYELGYTFKFGPENSVSTGLKSIAFDMNVQGSYENIMKFLVEIETGDRFIDIKNLSISQQQDKYTAVVTGLIYYSG